MSPPTETSERQSFQNEGAFTSSAFAPLSPLTNAEHSVFSSLTYLLVGLLFKKAIFYMAKQMKYKKAKQRKTSLSSTLVPTLITAAPIVGHSRTPTECGEGACVLRARRAQL